jgi:hypothetical protein
MSSLDPNSSSPDLSKAQQTEPAPEDSAIPSVVQDNHVEQTLPEQCSQGERLDNPTERKLTSTIGPLDDGNLPEEPNFRYSLLSLFVAMAVVAVGIVLLKWFWLYGFVIIFALTAGADMFTRRNRSRDVRILFAALWGIVFPLLCILYDPGILHPAWTSYSDPTKLALPDFTDLENLPDKLMYQSAYSRAAMFAIPLETMVLAAWIFWQPRHPIMSSLFAGALWYGAVLAGLVAVLMLPLTLIGLLVLFGVLGIIPFLTCISFAYAAREAWMLGSRHERKPNQIDYETWAILSFTSLLLITALFAIAV